MRRAIASVIVLCIAGCAYNRVERVDQPLTDRRDSRVAVVAGAIVAGGEPRSANLYELTFGEADPQTLEATGSCFGSNDVLSIRGRADGRMTHQVYLSPPGTYLLRTYDPSPVPGSPSALFRIERGPPVYLGDIEMAHHPAADPLDLPTVTARVRHDEAAATVALEAVNLWPRG